MLLAASLAVSSAGQATAQDSGEVTLVSTHGTNRVGNIQPSAPQQRAFWFTTGEASEDGYKLTSVILNVNAPRRNVTGTLGVALHADATDAPGAEVHEFPVSSMISGFNFRDVTFEGEVALEPNTSYWIVMTVVTGSVGLGVVPGGSLDSDGQSDWSLSDRYYFPSGSGWAASLQDHHFRMTLRGEVVRSVPSAVEPDGQDFAADSSTLGRLELGTLSSGTLSSSADRDLFKLENLPATSNSARDGQANRWDRKRYRVQAWFGDHAPGDVSGGEIFIMEAPSGSGSLYSSVSDTNEDGLSFFEFEAFPNIDYYAMVVPTAAIQVKSGSGYGLDTRTYTGAYKLQVVDVSNILEMVTTLDVVHPSGVARAQVTTGSAGQDLAVQFYTGWHGDGYVVNRVEAAVSNADTSAFAANAKVSVYSDSSGSPGTELFVLKTPADIWAGGFDDVEESFWAPSATTANNNLTRNTNYWVVFAMDPDATTGAYQLDLTDDTGETAQQGWVLGNTKKKNRNTTDWAAYSTGTPNRSIQIGVYASPNSTGHTHPVPLDAAPTGGI